MKNLFLSMALLFVVTLSFAQPQPPDEVNCIHVSLSCGVEYDICNFQGSMGQLISAVLFMDDVVCG